MRKIIICCVLLALCGSCKQVKEVREETQSYMFTTVWRDKGIWIYKAQVEGHEYLIIDGVYKSGIIHSESCPCKQDKI